MDWFDMIWWARWTFTDIEKAVHSNQKHQRDVRIFISPTSGISYTEFLAACLEDTHSSWSRAFIFLFFCLGNCWKRSLVILSRGFLCLKHVKFAFRSACSCVPQERHYTQEAAFWHAFRLHSKTQYRGQESAARLGSRYENLTSSAQQQNVCCHGQC